MAEAAAILRVRCLEIVLNPLSHATPTTVTRAEIQGTIDAVEVLNL